MEVGLAVGGAILSSVLNVFFDRMTPEFPELFRGRKNDEQILKKLKRTLRVIEAVVDDAEDKQITNGNVNEWLSDVKHAVHDAEDLVDEINTEVLRLRAEAGAEQGVTNAVSTLLPDGFLNEIIPKIEDVVSDLKDFESQIDVLSLQRRHVMKQATSSRLPSTSLVDESEVYGRDNEKGKLIDMVLNHNNGNGNNVSVIPIVGMGGLGKTTLAQLVYNDKRVEKQFHKSAWACVSENYDAFKTTQALVRKVVDEGLGEKDDLDTLQVKLNKSLKDKRFLIILDDVWNGNYNDWDKLKAPLKGGKEGSVVLVTTRDENVAKMMQTQDIFRIDTISHEDSWSLFKKHAFNSDHAPASPEFERIGKAIVMKCKGLPLAIKTVGGLLRSKTEVKEWEDILRSDFWNLDDKSNDILPVLRLSYYHLPPHLKRCFAFCAVFPKNYVFQEEELVLLWMANDFLQQAHGDEEMIECMEDVARKYFSQLRSMYFFQKKSDGGYLMHDLINDLARFVFGKFCVRLEDHPSREISSKVRHLSCVLDVKNAFDKVKFLSQARGLRTVFCTSFVGPSQSGLIKMFLSDILPQLGCLRVLALCGYSLNELSDSLRNLKHLRYVNFSWTFIRQLPNAICSLHNLQTLMLSYCHFLKELPKDITKLVNLHHLNLIGTDLREMPSHMSKLRSLQTLTYFIVDNSPGRRIEELGKLPLRGYLEINGLQNVTSCNDALKARLSDKNHLVHLVMQWNGITDDSQIGRDVLDKLQPHINLKSLTVDGYGGTSFPDWLGDHSFRNIVSLCLRECNNCFTLPTLGHLASLKYLTIFRLDSITRIGKEFYGDGSLIRPFASLMTLKIERMFKLEEWDFPPYADFSRLEVLIITKCPNLKVKLSPRLSSLREFEISGCKQFEFSSDWVGVVQDNQVGSLSHHLSSLQKLSISDIPNLKELPEGLLRLKDLSIVRCDGLVSFPKVMARADRMHLENCPSLVSPPIMAPDTCLVNCPKLEFPQGENSDHLYSAVEKLAIKGALFNTSALRLLPKLQGLVFRECESLEVFPSLQNLTLLRELSLFHCKKLKSLPEQMHSLLPSLRHLEIRDCPEIESFPKEGLPSSLEELTIWKCEKLIRNPIRDWGLERLPALRVFCIHEFNEESFPDEGLLPCSLRTLDILDGKNLKTLNEKGLLRLTFLQQLRIYDCPNLQSLPKDGLPISLESLFITSCPNLQSLPEVGLPTSLSELEVRACPMLKPHLEREKGKYWPIIAHIPIIRVHNGPFPW